MTNETTGVSLIAAERQRQIEVEGWSLDHDAVEHPGDQLAVAAVAYALPYYWRGTAATDRMDFWPWDAASWKPNSNDRNVREAAPRIRELVKAGALIAAEIDRLIAEGEQP